ncbi:MAG: hypothetical protein KC483_03320 [Nitrosarchaeum sp.]|nr:hypothetical protein [Nitrosarchaeum sp.]MCA9820349.1 hypothetical protein [Nitrosarchaeum sp.]
MDVKIPQFIKEITEQQSLAMYGIELDYAIIGQTSYEIIKEISRGMTKVRNTDNSLAIVLEIQE